MIIQRMLLTLFVVGLTITTQAQSTDGRIFNSDGYSVHYQQAGEGFPVILLHGFMTDTDQNWETLIPELSGHFTTIGMDLRGHGESEKSHDPADYGEELLNDIIRLMDFKDIEKAHIIGYSLGGFIAVKLAVEYPERVASVVAAGSGFHTREELTATGTAYAAGLRQVASPVDLLKHRYSEDELSADFLAQVKSNDKSALIALIQTIGELGVTKKEAQNLKMPVLAIAGENDPNLPKAQQLGDIVPHAQVAEIAGHHHLNTPLSSEFVSSIKSFLIQSEETASVN